MSRTAPAVAVLLVAVAALAAPAPSRAEGWTTYLRGGQYTAVIARHDTVWCASLEGGLQRFLVGEARFESIQRRPGGIASQALTALCFDHSGRLYAGSRDHGISRLSADGASWDVVSQLDGLPAGTVRALRAVGDTILIGTDHGVALWNGREMAGTVPEGVNPSPFASDAVNGVVLRGDSLWVATDLGLWASAPSTGLQHWSPAADFGQRPVLRLGWDGVTLLALVGGVGYTGGSVYRFDPASGTWGPTVPDLGLVRGLYDESGTILAAAESGIHRWTGASWSAVAGSPGCSGCVVPAPLCAGVPAATLDEAGRTWAANRDGLHELDGGAWTLYAPEAPVGNDIQDVALQGGRVYLTTFNEGVGRFDGTRWRNWPSSYGPLCGSGCDSTFLDPIFTLGLMADRQGHKWVGAWSGAIEELDDSGDVPVVTHHTIDDSLGTDVHTFFWSGDWDAAGGRWLGMDTNGYFDPIGVEYYDSTGTYAANYRPGPENPDMPTGQVRAVHVDRVRGNVWLGFGANRGVGVYAWPATPGGPLHQLANGYPTPLRELDIFGVVPYGRDSVWILSTANLQCYNAGSLTPHPGTKILPLAGGMPSRGACHPMDVGPDGSVWVGSDLYGVRVYHPGAASGVDYNTSNSPIAGDEVRAIRVDPATGVVWIGTATGLSRFDPAYVPPPPPLPPSLEVRAYPNPAWQTGAGPALRLAGNAGGFHGSVYDANGRLLRRFDVAAGQVFWDGRDSGGHLVGPGVYFVRVEAGTRARTLRIALLR